MFDYNQIKYEVEMTLCDYIDDYDMDAIMQDLASIEDENGDQISSIDDLESDEYWSIVERNERR